MNDKPYRKYQCGTCGFIYDEELGLPGEGLPPRTRFEDIPAGWSCPDCGMSKDQFELLEDE